MNREIAMQWADALESGKYEQARQQLRDNGKMCCLGVLCDIHAAATGIDAWTMPREGEWLYENAVAVPPLTVNEWCDAPNYDSVGHQGLATFSELNDKGATFAELAERIRREWESI